VPIAPREPERAGLLAAPPFGGPEPAAKALEIEPLDPDRRGPELPVMLAEEQRVQATRPIARAGRDHDRVGASERRRVRLLRRRPRRRQRGGRQRDQGRAHSNARQPVHTVSSFAAGAGGAIARP
jgi:hypothetical protein